MVDVADRPNRIPWPPMILIGLAAFAVVAGRVLPLDPSCRAVGIAAGAAAIGLGLLLDAAAMLTMRRHRANILPHRAATALVTTGPFAWSRNPIYLGNVLLLAGAALLFANPWFAVAAGLAAALTWSLAIRREEAHLRALFGAKWADYETRVPRWLGL